MVEMFIYGGIVLSGLIVLSMLWELRRDRLKKAAVEKSETADENRLHKLIEGTIGTTGETFFYVLVRELSQYLGVDSVIIASRDGDDSSSYRTLAYWCDDGYVMNQSISLLDSPCTGSAGFWHLESAARELFPKSSLLQSRFQVAGFFAVQLQDSSGNTIGLLAGLHRFSLRPDSSQIDIIKLFCARAASELERRLATTETQDEKERAQITLHSIGDGVITTDSTGVIDYMNPVAETLTGWRFHQAMGMSMEAILHLEDEISGRVIPDPARRCLSEKRVITPKTDNVLISRSGKRYSIQGTAAPMVDVRGDSIGVVLVFKDVTDSRRVQKMMVHQATHDPLTGLVNRSEFEERLEKAITSAKNFENNHVLLFLDLDQFKLVNDSAGHNAGDELLRQISSLLSSQLRARDTLGRMGGDEFSVLLENCPVDKAVRVAEVLIEAIRDYRFIWENKTHQIGVSIGVVAITADVHDKTELMNQADQACYAAKDMGRGCAYVFTDKDLDRENPQSKTVQRQDLVDAIAHDRFQLLYQPIVALDEESTGLHTRAEVLLRMLDDDDNYIAPGAFIPAANRFGLMKHVDRWVMSKLFRDYSPVFVQNPDLVLNLNLSAQSINDDSMIEFIRQLFDKTVIAPHQICFEVTENTLSHHFSNAGHFFDCVNQFGCAFAIDNFGSGLSSFTYLKTLHVDFLKLDGNLVRDIGTDEIDRSMVESISSMGHLMGIKLIAENVDSEAVVQEIKKIGIDYAQGYYLGDPVSLDDFTNLKANSFVLGKLLMN